VALDFAGDVVDWLEDGEELCGEFCCAVALPQRTLPARKIAAVNMIGFCIRVFSHCRPIPANAYLLKIALSRAVLGSRQFCRHMTEHLHSHDSSS
jgi:hypothetical protein